MNVTKIQNNTNTMFRYVEKEMSNNTNRYLLNAKVGTDKLELKPQTLEVDAENTSVAIHKFICEMTKKFGETIKIIGIKSKEVK